ncbi:hypothetical protein [endosymbiont GvMRE of Glomus versiforme]|uniref:hypothetical protein n=1 Tax=endosymbiont GvMRE of Glomus versiforme TaxID=2039283 RepID=UPI003CCC8459
MEEKGTVTKRENVNDFQVELNKNNQLVKASIANRFKREDRRWKKIIEGDKVLVEIPPSESNDLKGRIIKVFF